MKRISIIGAGIMAQGMARNFIEKDIEVYMWNRTSEKLRQLELQGVKICKSPKEAAEKADVVIECVSDVPASRSVWLDNDGILAGADSSKTLILSSTVSIEWVDELASLCRTQKLNFLDIALTGGPKGAATGTLRLLAGGSKKVLDGVMKELAAISSHVFHFGDVGTGMRFKLMQNTLSSIHINAAIQASKLAEKMGVSPALFYDAMFVGSMAPASPITLSVLADMASAPASANFSIRMLEKDMHYAKEMADEAGSPFDLLNETLHDFEAARAGNLAKHDLSNAVNMYIELDKSA